MNCGNCKFYFDDNQSVGGYKSGYGKCRRYPEVIKTNDGRWCGEYKEKLVLKEEQ